MTVPIRRVGLEDFEVTLTGQADPVTGVLLVKAVQADMSIGRLIATAVEQANPGYRVAEMHFDHPTDHYAVLVPVAEVP